MRIICRYLGRYR